MKVIKTSAIPIELPLKEPFTISNETVDSGINIFIKLETDNGLIGWGCATPDTVTNETKNSVLKVFNSTIKNIIIGKDPTRINQLNEIVEEKVQKNQSLKAGINIALYDLLGKQANMPLFRLLGGYRDKIETSITIGLNPRDLMVEKAKELVSKGFTCLKIKCGMDPNMDIEVILAIRKAVGPNIKIRLDANEGYNVEQAISVIKTLENLNADIEILEQPTSAEYLYALKEVTAQCPVPIMADETALTLRDSVKL